MYNPPTRTIYLGLRISIAFSTIKMASKILPYIYRLHPRPKQKYDFLEINLFPLIECWVFLCQFATRFGLSKFSVRSNYLLNSAEKYFIAGLSGARLKISVSTNQNPVIMSADQSESRNTVR